MRFSQLKPLIIANIHRSLKSNGIDRDHFDDQELDEYLNHAENIRACLSRRGLKTRSELRYQLAAWRDGGYRPRGASWVHAVEIEAY